MTTSAIAGFTPTVTSASSSSSGTNAMTSSDFKKVMIAQLQQQDPMNPSSSSDLLSQMSQISQLQSNQNLSTSLQGLTLQQSIGAGGNLIGKAVTGIDDNGDNVSGNVTSIKVQDKKVYLELDTAKELPLSSVTQIASNNGTGSSLTTSEVSSLLASPIVQSLMQSSAGQAYVQNLISGGGSYQSILTALSSLTSS